MHILIAEDDFETAEFIAKGLGELGHQSISVHDGRDGLHMALTEPFDVIVLDRMLPQLDGLSVLRRIRAAQVQVPVLLLTALGRIEDRVGGLEAGADDYLVKPFAFSELVARVVALSRRQPVSTSPPTDLRWGSLVLDLLRHEVRRAGAVVPLQPREFRLLEQLMRGEGRVVTRTMLLERVWDYHFNPHTNVVETHMSRLRAKLNEGDLPDLIETVRGFGYRMRDLG